MTYTEERISRFLQSPFGATVIGLCSFVALFVAASVASPFPAGVGHGIVFPSPNQWGAGVNDRLAAILMQALACGMLLLANYLYKFTRGGSLTFVALFLVLQCAVPSLASTFESGQVVLVVMLGSVMLLAGAYNRPKKVNNIVLAFFLVSAAVTFQTAFIGLLIGLGVGLVNLRIFRFKPLIAALMGCIAPWWILWCFGHNARPMTGWELDFSFLSSMPPIMLAQLIVAISIIVIFGAGITFMNLLRIIQSNAYTRSMCGLLITFGVLCTALIVIDSSNCAAYISLLNAVAALQMGYFMSVYSQQRFCYITVLSITGVCAALFVWGLFT